MMDDVGKLKKAGDFAVWKRVKGMDWVGLITDEPGSHERG